MMRMIYYIEMIRLLGLKENVFIIQILMVGCTLSSAIASNLAKGFDLDASVKRAKDYISGALEAMLDLGKGSGPMDHSFAIDNEYTTEYER